MAYTNSSMVAYTKLSPNHSGQRTHSIDRITPHCVAGQLSAESICGCFTSSSVQASCNYGIGSDGRVALCVEEKNRSWCSSNSANDQRAVTIECASDKTAPYAFKDVVYQTLIKLCVDICKRNGKTKLLWFGDKDKTLNYTPASNEMVLTVHRWFANKSCPGDWMYSRMSDLAKQVTAQLSGTTTTTTQTETSSNNEKTIWNYLKGKGLNDYAVAGIMGNLYAESGLNPQNLQNNGNTKLGMTDAEFTAAYDSEKYTNFVKDGYGYGLAQWTYYTRKQALADFAKAAGKSIGNLTMQLDFLWKELQGYTSVMKVLKSATTVRAASDAILTGYEKPADQGTTVQEKRAGYGQTYYKKYATSTTTTTTSTATVSSFPAVPFTVKVLISDLNIRKGAGTNYATTGKYTGKGTFTITEVKNSWGKLKSGAGWIYLGNPNYCTVQGSTTTTTTAKKSVTEIAKEVIAGKWGNGDARKKALTNAGYDYAAVQKKVNELMG